MWSQRDLQKDAIEASESPTFLLMAQRLQTSPTLKTSDTAIPEPKEIKSPSQQPKSQKPATSPPSPPRRTLSELDIGSYGAPILSALIVGSVWLMSKPSGRARPSSFVPPKKVFIDGLGEV